MFIVLRKQIMENFIFSEVNSDVVINNLFNICKAILCQPHKKKTSILNCF